MNQLKVAIPGGNGMLGHDLISLLQEEDIQTVCLDRPDFDITDYGKFPELFEDCNVIVNCAAYTAVDKAEEDTDVAMKVNAEAPGKLAEFCRANGIYLIQISTDFVFDGSGDEPWNETAAPIPLSVYGKSKLDGEKAVLSSYPNAAVIRVQWTYGKSGVNFITKITELAQKLPRLKVVADQIGAPTPTTEVAKAILDFIQQRPSGLFHFATAEYASRYDVALLIAKELNLDTEIAACSSDDFPAPAARPLNSRFNCSKIDTVLSFERPNWQNALVDYLKQK